jgi:hypothetical protein
MRVFSRDNYALGFELDFMRKLNYKKVNRVVKETDEGSSSENAAAVQKIGQRRVQQLYRLIRQGKGYVPNGILRVQG